MWRIIPVVAGILFSVVAFLVFTAVGPHVLAFGFGAVGAIFILIGSYYCIFRLEYQNGNFVAHPGKRTYEVNDVAFWKVLEDSDAAPGYRRYLELGFDKWYRRYVFSERDVSTQAFDALVNRLEEMRPREK